jgi:ABC-type antimicrobial peptide transport system permease subunit
MRILAGREFDWHDNETALKAAIISESLARRLFPSGAAIGRKLDLGSAGYVRTLEIVGVVNSASLWTVRSHEPMAIYTALMQQPNLSSSFVDVKVTGDIASTILAARRAIESMGRHVVLRADTLAERSDWALQSERMIAMLSSCFGGLALLLASIGLYGLMSYSVNRRTAELGVRMALGATSGGVLALVLRDVFWLMLGGIAVGVPTAIIAARFVSGMLFDVAGSDPITLMLAASVLLPVALLAGYIPARRASRIDPIVALRSE